MDHFQQQIMEKDSILRLSKDLRIRVEVAFGAIKGKMVVGLILIKQYSVKNMAANIYFCYLC